MREDLNLFDDDGPPPNPDGSLWDLGNPQEGWAPKSKATQEAEEERFYSNVLISHALLFYILPQKTFHTILDLYHRDAYAKTAKYSYYVPRHYS